MPGFDPSSFPGVQIHESAYVDSPCEIGEGTRIWHFCHVMGDSRIGRGCNLGQNVVISNDVVIGDNVKIQNNVSVYTGVVLEDDVFCGPSMVFTNVTNPRSEIPRRDEYRRTLVRQGATFGATVRDLFYRTWLSSARDITMPICTDQPLGDYRFAVWGREP